MTRHPTITINWPLFVMLMYDRGYRVSVHKNGEVFLRWIGQSKRSRRWTREGPTSFFPVKLSKIGKRSIKKRGPVKTKHTKS
jgi:hypothetical protein